MTNIGKPHSSYNKFLRWEPATAAASYRSLHDKVCSPFFISLRALGYHVMARLDSTWGDVIQAARHTQALNAEGRRLQTFLRPNQWWKLHSDELILAFRDFMFHWAIPSLNVLSQLKLSSAVYETESGLKVLKDPESTEPIETGKDC